MPPLCPGRDGRAGLPSACGAPRRVFVLRVSSPCRSCSPARPPLSCVCVAPWRATVWRRLLLLAPPYPTPPLRLLSSAPLCFLVSPHLQAAVASPIPHGFRLASRSAFSLVPFAPCGCSAPLGRLAVPPAHPPPSVCVSRVSSPCCLPSSVLLLPSRGFAPLGLLSCPPPPLLCFGVLLLLPCAGWYWCAVLPCSVLRGPVLLLAVLCCLGSGVLCFAVLCCCLLCCVVQGAVGRVVLCRVLLCFAGVLVLRCISSCSCALLSGLPCSLALCCVVVRCAAR